MSNGITGTSTHLGNRTNPYLVEEEDVQAPFLPRKSSKTIDQLFDTNGLSGTFPAVEQKKERLGLFKLLAKLLKIGNQSQATAVTDKVVNKSLSVDFTPVLDTPPTLPLNLKNFKLPQLTAPTSQLSDQDIFEGMKSLSDHSIYQIMSIVMATQSELAREGALIGLDDFEQLQKMQTNRQKILKEIKQVILKDEKLLAKFKTVQNIGAVVSAVAAIAALSGTTIPLLIVGVAI